jgi:hypothetical protein
MVYASECISAEESPPLSEAEKYVTNMVKIGVVADFTNAITPYEVAAIKQNDKLRRQFTNEWGLAAFKGQFSNDTARTLSSQFLEELLTTTNYVVHRHGVLISHAVVTNGLDLKHADIQPELWLDDCSFEGKVDFSRSNIRKSLSMAGSHFKTNADFNGINVGFDLVLKKAEFSGPCDFNGAKIGRLAAFNSAVFNGSVNFVGAEIGDQLQAMQTQFSNVTEVANFNGIKVGTVAFFTNAVFLGPVAFQYATIGFLGFPDARFTNPTGQVQFTGMKVGRSARFSGSTFSGPADFKNAVISQDFRAEAAHFTNTTETVTFSAMKVGGFAWFTNTAFAGFVDFAHADIGRNLECDGAQFSNLTTAATFSDIKVGEAALFRKSHFAGLTKFRHADIGQDFDASSATFASLQTTNDFTDIQVGQNALFTDAHFAGYVVFDKAHIVGDYEGDRSVFSNATHGVSFFRMKVGGRLFLQSATFVGPVNFSQIQIDHWLNAWGAQFVCAAKRTNNFQNIRVSGVADFDEATFAGPVDFSKADIGSDLCLRNVHFCDRGEGPKFNHVRVGGLAEFYSSENAYAWKRGLGIQLCGITYQDIYAGDESDDCERLLNLFEGSKYSDDLYGNLEALYRRKGNTHLADKAYVEGRWHEADQLPWYKRLWNRFVWAMVGYGRKPWLALVPSTIVLAFGFWAFHESKENIRACKLQRMEKMKRDDPDRRYNAFWFSLDLFAPIIDLESAKFWRPKDDSGFPHHYYRWHRILGWILIPFGVAALTGIIK